MVSPLLMSPSLGAPGFLAGGGIHRDALAVEGIHEDAAVGIGDAAVHQVAAGHALGFRVRVRLEFPLHRRAGFAQVERVQVIRERRDHVHRVADHDGRGFLAAVHPGRRR
jgi:hypothetical protein